MKIERCKYPRYSLKNSAVLILDILKGRKDEIKAGKIKKGRKDRKKEVMLMKNKVMLFSTLLFVFAVAGAASAAVTTTVGTFNSEAAAVQALHNWRGASGFTLLETFEGFDAEVPVGALPGFSPTNGQSSYSSFGNPPTQFFVDGGLSGRGQMRFLDPTNFGVLDRNVAPNANYGRTLNWAPNSFFGTQYLDSGDVTNVSLNHSLADLKLTSLFFFMFDVSDIDGRMLVYMSDGSIQVISGFIPARANGDITFLGIRTDANDFISKITWEMDSQGDGYGLDNFGTLNPVPLPASLLLLGSGLLGLGVVRRKK